MSSRTRSGRNSSAAVSPASPSAATRTVQPDIRSASASSSAASALSSTTSTRCASCCSAAGGGRDSARGGAARGSHTVNALPLPMPSLNASMEPPWSATSRRTSVSPMPRPPLARSSERGACAKRSKTLGSISSSMPMPVSRTRTATRSPSRCAVTSMRPPGCVYLAALVSRLAKICVRRTASPATQKGPLGIESESVCRSLSMSGRTVSTARCSALPSGTVSRRSSMSPRPMRETSSRSSTSRVRWCACRSIISTMRVNFGSAGPCRRRRSSPETMGERGLRSS